MTIVYYVKGCMYLNITNRCSNNCDFCVRRKRDEYEKSGKLWLKYEPEPAEILEAIFNEDWKSVPEIIFCGFGEPTMRFDAMMEVSRALKEEHPAVNLRMNTNGHANLITGRDVTPELNGLFRTVSVSLNYPDETEYVRHCRPMYRSKAFNSVLEFVNGAAGNVPNVILTVTSLLSPDEIEVSRKFARNLGVGFRLREII